MPLVPLPADAWTEVATTAANTVFQNRSVRPIYITGEDTTALPLDEGFELRPGESVIFETGVAVEASIMDGAGVVFYTEVEAIV